MNKNQRRKRITITVGYSVNEYGVKVPVRKEFTGKTLKEARQKKDDYLQRLKGGVTASGKQYFSLVSEQWRLNVFLNDGSLSPNTIRLYDSVWQRYVKTAEFFPMELDKISPMTIQDSINSIQANGGSQSAIKVMINMLRRFYRYLELNGIARNVMTSIVIPKSQFTDTQTHVNVLPEKITIWSDEELHKILTSFDKAQAGFRLRLLLVLASQTGCRISELLALEYKDFNMVSKTVSINKQIIQTDSGLAYGTLKSESSRRILPLTDFAISELKIHKSWHLREQRRNQAVTGKPIRDNIFTTKSGELVDRHNAATACNRYYDRIGVPHKGFHTYRHTFFTQLSARGASIETLASLAGHSSISVTAMYYIGISDERKAETVKLLPSIQQNTSLYAEDVLHNKR